METCWTKRKELYVTKLCSPIMCGAASFLSPQWIQKV